MDKILRCSKTSLSRIFRINYNHRGEMSWKQPLFQEKILPHRENVPETTAKPGETTAAGGKCPGNNSNSGRNHGRREKMSREQPLFQEKILPQRENVPETTAIPGETSAAKGKCPGNSRKTGRKLLPRKDFNSF